MDIRGQKGPDTPKPLGDIQASDQIQTQSQLSHLLYGLHSFTEQIKINWS